ncbi:hypothetical protein [Curtobacterium luteum]|uniref:Uncharacterized protein n=1 Tax=Curtobacterium luteum TaxID=33881 RepID=A0A175RRT9_9MICO|nr:hypothetical protein [Curtobacterium luteum]KTR06396.1 hypothetical protein NS184_09405 [Curtobacterium luteum]
MPTSTADPRPRTDRTVRTLGTLTAAAFALALAARLVVDAYEARAALPVQVTTEPPLDPYPIVSTLLAEVAVAGVGAGVLLFGALLVVVVRRSHRHAIVPWLVGGTVLLALTSAAASVVASQQTTFVGMSEWSTWRTALAGLATACLPAVCLAAWRARTDRAR